MEIDGWKYYNHAAIPTTAPHEKPNMEPIDNGYIWKIEGGTPLLARWTTEFDCGYETNWWYVIKDNQFDINALKAKRRYEINKGIKNFDVREIKPQEYIKELYEIFISAYESWPKKYRPKFTYNDMKKIVANIVSNPRMVCYGGFCKETGELCGFSQLSIHDTYAEFNVQRVKQIYEKFQINAAMVNGMLENMYEKLEQSNFYILDGARCINHETNFQDYLEKYFGFRKAYCKLYIQYNPKMKWLIILLFPFRKLLRKLDSIGMVHQINSVMKMEEICRNNRK